MKSKSKFRSLLIIVAILAMVFVTACGNSGDATKPDTGDTGGDTPPATSDGPQLGGNVNIVNTAEGAAPIGVPWENVTTDSLLLGPCVEALVVESSEGIVTPWLAKSFEVDLDKGEIRFVLEEGVKFHDDTDFNADAAVFCLEKAIADVTLVGATGVYKIADYEIAITFDEYANSLLNRLAARSNGFVSPTAFEANGIEWARENPVATGPFKFESYTRGEECSFVKNENYWRDGQPYVDSVKFLFIKDVMTVNAAMQASGDQAITMLNTVNGEQISTLRGMNPDFRIDSMPIGPLVLVPDSTNESSPLANVEVRKAIAWAIDRDSIVAARGFGVYTPATQMISKEWPAFLPETESFGYDVEKAKKILADAGYPDGFATKIAAMPNYADRDSMVILQSQLAEIGITVELEFPDSGGYNNYRSNGWDGMLAQHFRAAPNLSNMLNIYLVPDTSLVDMKRPDGLLDALKIAREAPEQDFDLLSDVYQIMQDDVTMIPIFNIYDTYINQPYFHDAEFSFWGSSTMALQNQMWLSDH